MRPRRPRLSSLSVPSPALGAAALAATTLAVAPGVARADDGWIFSTCNHQLCRVDGDGTRAVVLTANGLTFAGYDRPAGSRDGTVLGYDDRSLPNPPTAFGNLPTSVFVVRPAEATGPQKLATNAVLQDLSADGTRALVQFFDGGDAVCTVSTVDGGDRRCLTTRRTDTVITDLLPGGALLGSRDPIGFSFRGVPPGDVVVELAPDGSERRVVAALDGYGLHEPELSPDGRFVVAAALRELEGAGRIGIFDAATGALVRWLTAAGEAPEYGTDDSPTWSPDGLRVAFHRQDPGYDQQVYVIAADGVPGSERRVGPGDDPAWTLQVTPRAAPSPVVAPVPAQEPRRAVRPRPVRVTLSRTRIVVLAPAAARVRLRLQRETVRHGRVVGRRTVLDVVRRSRRTETLRVPLARAASPGRYRVTVTVRRDDGRRTPAVRLVRRLR